MAEKSLVNDDAEIVGTEPLDALLDVDGVLDELLVLLELEFELPHAARAHAAVRAHTAVKALPLSNCIYFSSPGRLGGLRYHLGKSPSTKLTRSQPRQQFVNEALTTTA
jgi:hypothetical protein